MKKIAIALLCAASLGGCTSLDSVLGTNTASLTPAQKVTLAAEFANGVCVLTAAGLSFSGGVNSIVHPNATTGGSGASAAGTLVKASAIDSLSCQALNGAVATLLATTTTGAATVQVTQ